MKEEIQSILSNYLIVIQKEQEINGARVMSAELSYVAALEELDKLYTSQLQVLRDTIENGWGYTYDKHLGMVPDPEGKWMKVEEALSLLDTLIKETK